MLDMPRNSTITRCKHIRLGPRMESLILLKKITAFKTGKFIFSHAGMPSIFHIFAHTIPVEERSRAFGYLVALGSIGQTVAALVSINLSDYIYMCEDKT